MTTPLPTPACTFPIPGLVRLLTDYPANLPTPADDSRALAQQVRLEVADFLDARQQSDIALSQLTPGWYRDFRAYLDTFHAEETVTAYLEITIQISQTASQNPNQVLPNPV